MHILLHCLPLPLLALRELLLLSDGGQLYLDWCNDGYDERTQTVSDPERPTVIILPGITGEGSGGRERVGGRREERGWCCSVPSKCLSSVCTRDGGMCIVMCGLTRNSSLSHVVCMHGTGSFDENYIHHFVQDAQLAGHRAVVFNYRGLGGAMLRVSGWGGGEGHAQSE